jgi:hypothetical protein
MENEEEVVSEGEEAYVNQEALDNAFAVHDRLFESGDSDSDDEDPGEAPQPVAQEDAMDVDEDEPEQVVPDNEGGDLLRKAIPSKISRKRKAKHPPVA